MPDEQKFLVFVHRERTHTEHINIVVRAKTSDEAKEQAEQIVLDNPTEIPWNSGRASYSKPEAKGTTLNVQEHRGRVS
ncbi:MAG: hypothetical protein GY906_12935 [bacterium]|nr:hypothetical protein [bacterium]